MDQQHSLRKSIFLHLFPGVLIVLFYSLIVQAVRSQGYPSTFAIFLSILIVLIPFEIGWLLYEGKKKNGKLSFTNIVVYREKVPVIQFIALAIVVLVWSSLSLGISAATDSYFISNLFSWVPKWFFINEDLAKYSKDALRVTILLGFILNGFLGPITEELYFRGYLLPRISRYGKWAPVLNTLLFSLYHFFTPWQNLGRIIGTLPFSIVAQWKKNIYISMVAHILGNTLGMLGLLIFIQ
jgi:membrane protease YdiL (CAAX protease family)